MSEQDDIDVLAAEYVLGTLDADERASVARRRTSEPALDKAIAGWERRLGPLAEAMPSAAPPADLLARIEARIEARAAAGGRGATADVIELRSRLRRWKWIAGAASAAAALSMVLFGVRELSRPSSVQTFVGVFTKDDAAPAFVLTVDLSSQTLTIRSVNADALPDKSYQLWIKPTPQSPPRSLGVIAGSEHRIGTELAVYRPDEVRGATFGVSVEPRGGSPTGQPTGPVLHAKLLPGRP
jgi:anti-sigma-K factor RskA